MEEMNECLGAIMAKYLAGEASPEETAQLTAWIGEDRSHAREFARLTDIDQVVRPPFDPAGISVDIARERTMLLLQGEERRRRRLRFVRGFERAAAVLFLPLVLVSVYLFMARPEPAASDTTWQTVTTPFRTQTQLELPDGSKVWLNGGSTLRYPLAFGAGERSVSLTGEAYFEVKSDKTNPFVVHTKTIGVTATGTAFNVDAFRNDNVVSVTMVRGVVDVDMKGETRRMAPGERICYDNRLGTYTVDQTDSEKWCAWRNGEIIFENDRLDYVFHRLGQLYNVEFTVCDPSVNCYVYHAVFTDETLPEILEMLKISAPIRYEILQADSPAPNIPKHHIRVYGK